MKKIILIPSILLVLLGGSLYLTQDRLSILWYEINKENNIPPAQTKAELEERQQEFEAIIEEEENNVVAEAPLVEETENTDNPEEITTDTNESEAEEIKTFNYPDELNLDLQFYAQAPFGNWELPFKEACEESSMILAYNFLNDIIVTREEFQQKILDIVDYQKEVYGDYIHSDMKRNQEILEDYFGYTETKIIENPSIEDLKIEIALGHPIIVPLAGQEVGNPYYTEPGPEYHVLVLKGYTKTHFITHDVGTKRGEDFSYPINTFMESIHDLNFPIQEGIPRVLVLQ